MEKLENELEVKAFDILTDMQIKLFVQQGEKGTEIGVADFYAPAHEKASIAKKISQALAVFTPGTGVNITAGDKSDILLVWNRRGWLRGESDPVKDMADRLTNLGVTLEVRSPEKKIAYAR